MSFMVKQETIVGKEFLKDITEEVPSFVSHIQRMIFYKREEVLKQVMKQVLGRDPRIEDGLRFSFIKKDGVDNIELVAFDNEVIGRLSFDIKEEDRKWKYEWLFEPKTTFN